MADQSSSSPEERISVSTEGKSKNHQSSSSLFQRSCSQNNNVSISPIGLPPLLPPQPPSRAAAKSTPGSQARGRGTSLRSKEPIATSDTPQPFGLNSPPPPNNSQTLQELGPQEKPIIFGPTQNPILVISRDDDGEQQNSPLPISAQPELIKEMLFSGLKQDFPPSSGTTTHTGQALPSGIDPVSVFSPSFSNVPNINQPLQFASNSPGYPSAESVVCNCGESYHSEDNNQTQIRQQQQQPQPQRQRQPQPRRMIITHSPPEDGDTDPGVWVGPPPGYFKLNVAVILCNVGGVQRSCLGAVVRNHAGVAQIAISILWGETNPTTAESLIYEMGIVYSRLSGFRRLIAETESPFLVHQCGIIAQLPGLCFQYFDYFRARQVSRSANAAAHRFAGIAQYVPMRPNIIWGARDISNFFGTNAMPF